MTGRAVRILKRFNMLSIAARSGALSPYLQAPMKALLPAVVNTGDVLKKSARPASLNGKVVS